MILGDGTKVLVTAWSHPTTVEIEGQLSEVKAHAMAEGASERPVPRVFAWGYDNDSGIPFVLDAGDPRPPATRPPAIPRYDGPPNVVVRAVPTEPTVQPEGV